MRKTRKCAHLTTQTFQLTVVKLSVQFSKKISRYFLAPEIFQFQQATEMSSLQTRMPRREIQTSSCQHGVKYLYTRWRGLVWLGVCGCHGDMSVAMMRRRCV